MTYMLSPSAIKDQFDSNNRYKRMTILSGGDRICARFFQIIYFGTRSLYRL